MKPFAILLPLVFACFARAAQEPTAPASRWKAGTAVANITPDRLLHMAGYAAHKEPAEGTEQELFAKSLAIEDRDGNRVVIVTMDLIGVAEKAPDGGRRAGPASNSTSRPTPCS